MTTTADEPGESVIEATLTAEGDRTLLVWEERGMPLDQVAAYGASVQIHPRGSRRLPGRARTVRPGRAPGTSSCPPIGTSSSADTTATAGAALLVAR